MEGGFPILGCHVQHTLRSLCSSYSDSSNPSSKWVYAVFWRIVPRNFPPPKWDFGGGYLDRARGNKRNWILVWEDGFCDFYECERGRSENRGRFGADIFFKMSHEVYSYGEGVVGKVAAESSHKWVYRDSPKEHDPSVAISTWNASFDANPRPWEFHFSSGIQVILSPLRTPKTHTIALVSVREGVIQLGSFDKIKEDFNLVINTQKKFSYIQNIPGILFPQRPHVPQLNQNQDVLSLRNNIHEMSSFTTDDKAINKSINWAWNSLQNGDFVGPTMWSRQHLLPNPQCTSSVPAPAAMFVSSISGLQVGNIKLESGFDGEGKP